MSGKPASQLIADDIRFRIKIGTYKDDDMLPSENEFCEKFHVSRATVQKALNQLYMDNLIYSVPGKGSFVKNTRAHMYKFSYDEFKGCDVKLIGVDIISPTIDVVYNLRVSPKKRVPRIQRLICKDNIPIAYDVKYVPYTPGTPLFEAKVDFSSFSELLSNVASAYEITRELTIRTERCTEDMAELLHLTVGSSLIVYDQILMSDEDIRLGWGVTVYNPKYFMLEAARDY